MNRWLKYFIKLAISIAILLICFYSIDFDRFENFFLNIDPILFIGAFVVNVIGTIVMRALITKIVLQTNDLRLSLTELIKINFITRFYTIILPRGVATGIRWYRYRMRGPSGDAFVLVVFENLLNIFVLMLAATIFLTIDIYSLPKQSIYILIISSVGLFFSATIILLFFSERFSNFSRQILNFKLIQNSFYLSEKLEKLWKAVTSFHKLNNSAIIAIIGFSFLSYALFIISPYILSIAMDLSIGIIAIAWIRSLVLLMALIPISVAGLGVREAGFIGLMHLYGVANHEALAFAMGLFLIQILIGLIGALTEAWDNFLYPLIKRFGK
jgi:uncharacterized protein (TIRG00374 family)